MRARARSTRRDGFTLIEVMMAVGIMTVGAVAIMAMIQASTRGNAEARALTNATQNTQLWIDRLQRLSVRFTQGTQNGVLGIPYLNALHDATSSGWFTPGADAEAGEDGVVGLDWQGNPVGEDGARFCTLLNLSWINVGRAIRAEVITYYPRRSTDSAAGGADAFTCTAGADGTDVVTELGTASSRFTSVRAATVLRWSPLP